MKKKNSLFKVILCAIGFTALLTWLLKAKYFNGSEMTVADQAFYRIGIFDLLE